MPSWFQRRRESSPRADRVVLAPEPESEITPRAILRPRTLAGLGVAVVVLVLLEVLFPRPLPGGRMALQIGQVAREDVVAPFDFDVLKTPDAVREERATAEAGVVPVFRFDPAAQEAARKRFGGFLTSVYGVRGGPEPERQKLDMLGELGPALGDTSRRVLLSPARSGGAEELAREILLSLHERGVIGGRGAPVLQPDDTVIVLRADEESIARARAFNDERNLRAAVRALAAEGARDRDVRTATVELVVPFATANIVYDAAETARRKEAARNSVGESTGRDFRKDEVIVHRGERVTEEHMAVLRSVAIKAQSVPGASGAGAFVPSLGRVLMAALLLGALALYAGVRKPQLLADGKSQGLFMVLVIIVMLGAALVKRIPNASEYLVPVAVLAVLASMLFDFEIAFASTVTVVMLAGLYTEFAPPFLFVSLVGGTVAAHSVRSVRHREDFYWSALRIAAAYAVAILVADLLSRNVNAGTLSRCGWGALNTLISMGIVVLTLPLFERGFVVTTDITLLELGDMNKPLLRKMAMTAPGTYHHSIVVGNLAEAASDAAGGNGLLARVGSYYHDIGKLVSPGYFVENQQGLEETENKHAGIRPKVSSLVIRAHVRDGVDLARKERLPEPVIDFIREHHGTSLIEYFHSRALEDAEDPSEINEADYRYGGPTPRSKESAIISLADTIEARVRSIGESLSPRRIEAEIEEIIEKRVADHQLDDAELTLSDLVKIREAFFRVLVGMYHQRIRYPDQEDDAPAPEGV
jgi:putative nucleotidyltransferase with HDIG domain